MSKTDDKATFRSALKLVGQFLAGLEFLKELIRKINLSESAEAICAATAALAKACGFCCATCLKSFNFLGSSEKEKLTEDKFDDFLKKAASIIDFAKILLPIWEHFDGPALTSGRLMTLLVASGEKNQLLHYFVKLAAEGCPDFAWSEN